ncbi:MAG: porin [Fuerstiella sp.]|nr:porin [Fuerstiella sp.]MCP4854476.1 porin [Fuerstiella sp.]
MLRRSWSSFLAGVAFAGGMAVVSAVSAGEIYTAEQINARAQQLLTAADNEPIAQLASVSSSVNGCTSCSTSAGCGGSCGDLFGARDCDEISFGGWIQMGYHNKVTPRGTAPDDARSFNNHPDHFNLHQGWLYAEKIADGSCGPDWGFRMDVMYGVDAGDTQAFGNRPGRWDNGSDFNRGGGYGWAIPQLYSELASGDWNIKIGHFYTLVGYEVVTAPDNFFYSHALTMFNSEPFTHTGALATFTAGDDVTLYAGWTAGWDTGFDRVNGGSSFLGGFSTALGEEVTFTYITTFGNFGARGAGASGYSHSLVVDTALADDLNYVIQSDLVDIGVGAGSSQVGLNQYLIKTISDRIGVGVRSEWWKSDGAFQYAVTGGVNVRAADNLIIRPEVRYDWQLPTATGDQVTFGMDAILTF